MYITCCKACWPIILFFELLQPWALRRHFSLPAWSDGHLLPCYSVPIPTCCSLLCSVSHDLTMEPCGVFWRHNVDTIMLVELGLCIVGGARATSFPDARCAMLLRSALGSARWWPPSPLLRSSFHPVASGQSKQRPRGTLIKYVSLGHDILNHPSRATSRAILPSSHPDLV